MATFTHREIVSRRIEYIVPAAQPWGATRADLYQALMAAESAYRQAYQMRDDQSLSDDALRVLPMDDEIVISFTIEGVAGRGE